MSLHTQLLSHADHLVRSSAPNHRQANLRRAISSAYYAVFHLLTHHAVRRLIGTAGSQDARELRHQMSRWFQHSQMKVTSGWFKPTGKIPPQVVDLLKYSSALPAGCVPAPLSRVATAFIDLQEARHSADYDLEYSPSRQEAQTLVTLARQAFTDWNLVAGTFAANLYLFLLLNGKASIPER